MSWRTLFRRLLIVIAIPIVVWPLSVYLRWGHWGTPPSVDRVLEGVVAVDRFSAVFASELDASFLNAKNAVPLNYFSAKDHVLPGIDGASRTPWRVDDILGAWPTGRFAKAIVDRDLIPISNEPIDPKRVRAAREILLAQGSWRGGFTSFPRPPAPYAEFAEGRDANGSRVLLVAFPEPEISNDHFPYTEARMRERPDGQLELEEVTSFYFDHAGMEGIFPWYMSIIAGLLAFSVWIAFAIVKIVIAIVNRLAPNREPNPEPPSNSR